MLLIDPRMPKRFTALVLGASLSAGLAAFAALHAAGRAYFANRFDNTLGVVDTTTDLSLSPIPVDNISVNFVGVAVDAAGRLVYVTNRDVDTVSIVDTTTGRVAAVIPVCNDPIAVAAHPSAPVAYVTCTSSVTAIDPIAHSVIVTAPIGLSWAVAVHPDGSRVYVAMANALKVLDSSSLDEITTIPLGSGPDGVAVSPDGAMVYVAMRGDDTLRFIDAATNVVVDAVTVGHTPRGVAVDPMGERIYVASQDGDLTVVDAVSRQVIAEVPVSSFSVGVEPDGLKVYVPTDDGVFVVDTQTNQVVNTLDVGGGPFAFGAFIGPAWPDVFADGFEDGDLTGWLPWP